MIPTSTPSSFSFSSACALNNMGVTLLLQGQFDAAAVTLKDALSVMRGALTPNGSNELGRSSFQAASARIIPQNTHSDKSSTHTVCVEAVDSHDTQSLLRAISSFAASQVTAIHIRDTCHDEANLEIQSGIILHNYGLACFLTAQLASSCGLENKTTAFQTVAHKCLLMANAVFCRQSCENDATQDLQTSLLSLMALSCTSLLLRATHKYTQAMELEQYVVEKMVSVEIEHCGILLEDQNAAAAAA